MASERQVLVTLLGVTMSGALTQEPDRWYLKLYCRETAMRPVTSTRALRPSAENRTNVLSLLSVIFFKLHYLYCRANAVSVS